MVKHKKDIQARRLLETAELYCTRCRLAILKIFIKTKKPLSQKQISERLGEKVNKTTVYRNLEVFLSVNLIHKVNLPGRKWYYEIASNCTKEQCHPHFICTDCGKTYCFKDLSLPMTRRSYKGFIIKHQKIQLEGICSNCI